VTRTTSAVIPGVPTLPPSARIASVSPRADSGSTTVRRSTSPRTQRGTVTGSRRTFSSPAARIALSAHSTARSPAAVPEKRRGARRQSSSRRA
jgi:hypothetical protein